MSFDSCLVSIDCKHLTLVTIIGTLSIQLALMYVLVIADLCNALVLQVDMLHELSGTLRNLFQAPTH